MSFRVVTQKIKLSDATLKRLGQAALDTIKAQASEGISARGEHLTTHWRDSGQLMDTATVDDQGSITWPAPYAGIVNQRAPFMGISPNFEQRYHDKIKPLLDEGLTFDKDP